MESVPESDRTASNMMLEDIPEEDLLYSDHKIDVHDENRILFFRHFVDALVRVAYLKYGGAPKFAKNVEKVLAKIRNCIENRKKAKTSNRRRSTSFLFFY